MKLKIMIDPKQDKDTIEYLRTYYSHYKKKYETDSGIDLVIPTDHIIEPRKVGDVGSHPIPLGICTSLTDTPHVSGYYLYPRSSISKTNLRLANCMGIIDYSYRGTITAMVDNIGDTVTINKGTKLFQLCSPDLSPLFFELADSLDTTDRGDKGFGSTS